MADAAVAPGLDNAGDPIIVTTSLLEAGITATGVMPMVTVDPAAPARTSERVNIGPVRPPSTISGNNPVVERLRTRFEESITAALTALLCACTPGFVKPVRVMEIATPAA